MKKKIILPLLISLIMILSIIGFSLNLTNQPSEIKYKNHKFTQLEQGWLTYLNNKPILISSNPKELENINLPDISIQELNSAQKIYITFNPEEDLEQALYNLELNIKPLLNSFIPACTKDTLKCSNLPLKTCSNVSLHIKIIQLEESNSSSISYTNNCLLIQGTQENIVKQTDALILSLLGI